MEKRTKIIIYDSFAESMKIITSGIFAGLIVVVFTGQSVIPLDSIWSYLIIMVIWLIGVILTWIVFVPYNLIKKE